MGFVRLASIVLIREVQKLLRCERNQAFYENFATAESTNKNLQNNRMCASSNLANEFVCKSLRKQGNFERPTRFSNFCLFESVEQRARFAVPFLEECISDLSSTSRGNVALDVRTVTIGVSSHQTYSVLSACTGSVEAARRAGIIPAMPVAVANVTIAITITVGFALVTS